jgi:hypothetical protein
LLTNADIRAEIDARLAEQSQRIGVEADQVVDEWRVISFSDPIHFFYRTDAGELRLREIDEMSPDARRAIASIKVKKITHGPDAGRAELIELRLWSKTEALVSLSKHKGLLADGVDCNIAFGLSIVEEVVDTPPAPPVVEVALPNVDPLQPVGGHESVR